MGCQNSSTQEIEVVLPESGFASRQGAVDEGAAAEGEASLQRSLSKTLLSPRSEKTLLSRGESSRSLSEKTASLQRSFSKSLLRTESSLTEKSDDIRRNKSALFKQGTSTYLEMSAAGCAMAGGPGQEIRRQDLTTKGLLGAGFFGMVELVEHNESRETFAMKAYNKAKVVINEYQSNVIDEKNAQMMCDSPFIIKLYATYSDFDNLYLLLELSLGGEVRQLYYNQLLFGSKVHTQFYLSGCVYALEHMHERDIVFGDLKPDNMLITETGHIKLADFGCAKISVGKTFTSYCHKDFSAPEMSGPNGYEQAADWWSLGVTTFFLMTGRTLQVTKTGIDCGLNTIFLREVRGDCEDFIKQLCKLDPEERLPMKQGGIQNIQGHKWFEDFDWKAMHDMTLEPPYKPNVNSKTDLSNFYTDSDMVMKLTYNPSYADYNDGSHWSSEFATID